MNYFMWINRRSAYIKSSMRLCIAIAMILASTAALGQSNAEFLALDRNRDGYISRVEALANSEVQKRFSAFDGDKDGRLTEEEYAAAMEDNQKRVLQDSVITARVKAALLAEKGIPSLAISVETYEGQVQLSGLVKAAELVSRAGRVTAGVTGVRTVHNNITVR